MRHKKVTHTKEASAAFGERLRNAIKNSTYRSQKEVGKMLGIKESTFNSHCQGIYMPWSDDIYDKYANALGVHAYWLRTGEGPILNFDDPKEDDCVHQEQAPLDRTLLINIAKALIPENTNIDTEEFMTAIASIYDSVNSKNVSPEMKTILLDTTIQAVKQVQEKQTDQEPH